MNKDLNSGQAEELHRIILNDPHIRALEARLFRLYSLVTPQTILNKNGDIETLWIDSDNDPALQLIKDSIDSRKRQLSSAYCGGHVLPFTIYDEIGPPPWASDEEKKDFVKAYEMAKPKIDDEQIKAYASLVEIGIKEHQPKFITCIDPYKRLAWWQKLLNFLGVTKYNTNVPVNFFNPVGRTECGKEVYEQLFDKSKKDKK